MGIANSMADLVGSTPMVRLNNLTDGLRAGIFVKLEFFNPLSSIKDRIGKAMIEDAEKKGLLKKDSVIIEPTSGNTGIALAFMASVRGYKLILTMPDTMSVERRKLLKALGAELILTPGSEGMNGAIKKAESLLNEYPNSYMPQQFKNKANPRAHIENTAEEIWKDTNGSLDIFIAGVGTGGTVSGVGKALKLKNPLLKVYAVEPAASAVISGENPGKHKIQGIGAGFIPDNLDRSVLDGIIKVGDSDAMNTARALAKNEGILGGISSGANVWAALQEAAKPENSGKKIVTVICDTGERYLSSQLWED